MTKQELFDKLTQAIEILYIVEGNINDGSKITQAIQTLEKCRLEEFETIIDWGSVKLTE